jgi:uncharacterized protein (DUF362 family)
MGKGKSSNSSALICPWGNALTRRRFLKGCAYVAAGVASYSLTGPMGGVFGEDKEPVKHLSRQPSTVCVVKAKNHELVGESWKNPFNPTPNGDPPMKFWKPFWSKESEIRIEEMVRQAIKVAGDWPVEKGDVVAIKPNLVASPLLFAQMGRHTDPELQCSITDARVVRAVANLTKESGAKDIYLVSNPMVANGYINLRQWGYGRVAKEVGAKLAGLSDISYKDYKASLGLAYKQYALPTLMVDEVNKVISVAALKTHSITRVTLTLKNIGIGTPTGRVYGGPRLGLPHEKIAEVITDVCSIVGIDYAIIDGIWGMEGNGPLGGDPVPMDLVIAGPDPVAVDAVGTELMGIPKESIGTTRMAKDYGIGTYEGTKVKVVGDSFEKILRQFDPVPKKFRFPGSFGDVYGWDGL